MKLLIYSQASTVQPLKFGNGSVISSHRLLGMWLFIHVSKRVPISRWYLITGMLRCVCCKHFGENLFCCYCTALYWIFGSSTMLFSDILQTEPGRTWYLINAWASKFNITYLMTWIPVHCARMGMCCSWYIFHKKNVCLFEIYRSNIERHWDGYDMDQVTELRLSCYLVLLSINSKTR